MTNDLTHWLIQLYTDKPLEERKNVYIPVHDNEITWGVSKLDLVFSYCIKQQFDIRNITVLETSSQKINISLIQLLQRANK